MKEILNKARTPVQKRGIETKAKIIEAASLLFCEKGFHNTNSAEIASRAGLATGTFYSYFNDKKEVLVEVIRLFYSEVIIKVISAMSGEIPDISQGRSLANFIIQSFYRAHAINPRLHKELSAMILLDKDVEKINRMEERRVISLIIPYLESYREHLRVTDLEAAAEMIYQISDEVIHRVQITGTDIEGERLLKELEDMMCRYLLKDA